MLTEIIESLTELSCQALDETGNCIVVLAPRPFEDDPELFLFIQRTGNKFRLTDDAEVYLYHGGCDEAFNEIGAIVRGAGLEFNNATIELTCDLKDLQSSIAKFLCAMSALAAREHDFNRMCAHRWSDEKALAAK